MLAFGVSLLQLQMFFLVFLRTGAFLMALPLVNAPSVPVFFRIGLTFVDQPAPVSRAESGTAAVSGGCLQPGGRGRRRDPAGGAGRDVHPVGV